MTPPSEASALARRYRRLMLTGSGLLLLLLAALIWREYQLRMAEELQVRAGLARERLVAVQAIADAADVHVAQMRAAVDAEFGARVGPSRLAAEIAAAPATEIFATSKPDPAVADRRGVVVGPRASLAARPADDPEFTGAERLFALASTAHKAQPSFHWSYYFSARRDLVAIWPWTSAEELLGPPQGALKTLAGYYDYNVYKMTKAASNPGRSPIWTPVYFDAGGAGLMVSHNAPVDRDGRQVGMVGTDVVLTVFSQKLALPEGSTELLVLVDQDGSVVADSRGGAAAAREVTRASALLFDAPAVEPAPAGFRHAGDMYRLDLAVAGTPWRLAYEVPASVVRDAAFSAVLPYLVFLGVLLLILGATSRLVAAEFVLPAIGIAGMVERLAAGGSEERPKLPGHWQPWANRIAEAFAALAASTDKLRAAEHKTRAVIDVALDAVVTVDRECRVIDFNPAAERIFGYRADDVRGRPIGELIVPHHLKAAHDEGVARYTRTGVPHVLGRRVELEGRRADGTLIPVELQIHAIDDVAGVRFAAYVRDLTEQKQAVAEITRQREKLHQSEKMSAMGSLLAGLAHELNNPLAVVVAQSSLVEETVLDDASRRRVSKVRQAAERCGRIVKIFLSMARQQTPSRTRVQVDEVIERAMEIVAYGLRASGAVVEKVERDRLPAVEADEDQLTQVIINLVLNANQAFDDRHGDRRIWVETARAGEDRMAITVADNGPGVPPAIRDSIFEAFFTTKPNGVGTGIGLAVCRNIVEAHGGTLTLHDRPGGGAAFRIELPLTPANAVEVAPTPAVPAVVAPLSILVVDDEPDVADTLAGLLELDGHRVRIEIGMEAATAALGNDRFDFVFCDLHMPGGGGTALRARVAERWPRLVGRFAFVTGDMVSGPATIARQVPAGDAVVLGKPFEREEIRSILAGVPGPVTADA